MKLNNKYNPILFLTALPFESGTILNHHQINVKPKKLTPYPLEESIQLIEVPIGFKFDSSTPVQRIRKIAPALIVNLGICGALDSAIPIGSCFYIDKVCHFNKEFSEIRLPAISSAFHPASLLTVDQPVLEMNRRNEVYSRSGCRLVDMEAFYIARFCKEQNIALRIIKVSSDWADENSLDVIKANRTELKRSLAKAYVKILSDLAG